MLRTTAIAILLAACGNGGPPHWKDQPLQTFSGTTGGHAYSIDLPKGTAKSTVESKYSDDYDYHTGGRTYAPSVSVSWNDKKDTLDQAVASEHDPVLDKTSDDGGWAYVTENSAYKGSSDYIINAQRFVGDGAFSCHARVFPMVKGEDVKTKLVPLVEKMCASLKAK
jgi:hypothetical protein